MTSRIRLLFAWLLLALLPLQGVAAAAMSGCPGHQGAAHASVAQADPAAADDAMHDGHCEREPGQKPAASCDSCTNCCLAGALALPVAPLDVVQARAWAPIAFVPAFAPPVVPARLDRPPR